MELAVMKIEKGEEIAASMVSGHISGTGRYKLLAKKKKNGRYEWAHFMERDTGVKEGVYRGEVKDEKEFAQTIITLLNDTKKREKIGKEARDLIEKNYSWEYRADEIFKLLQGGGS